MMQKNDRRREYLREYSAGIKLYFKRRPAYAWEAVKDGRVLTAVIAFFRGHAVLTIALLAALATMLFVPPDEQYKGYFDVKTLTCLFSVLAVVRALTNVNFFYMIARRLVALFKNERMCILALVVITFIGSMFIANDMALITFLPLGYFVLHTSGKEKHMAFTFIMQNIAANLGGMLTPFGNPQNLYLYTKYSIPTVEFMQILFPPFIVAVSLIVICCLFIKKEPLSMGDEVEAKCPIWRLVIYLLLFALSILIVFRGIPYWIGLIVIPIALIILDRNALKTVDYPLLMTFVCFFVFSGNMARIEPVRNLFAGLLEKNTLLVGALSCQVISNVPSAILLSQFTQNYADLLVAVNIGGTGTLIASLASLITFGEFSHHFPERKKEYLIKFSAYNFSFLAILLLFCEFIL